MSLMNGASKNSLQENIKTEIDAGKPLKQAEAIAYSKRREILAKKRGKKG